MLRAVLSICLLVCPVSALLHAQAAASSQPKHPVQYSSKLNVSSPPEIDQRLDAPFTEGTAHPGGANNCRQLLAQCGEATHGKCGDKDSQVSDKEVQARKSTLVDCLVLSELRHAAPARVSHLKDLKWDEHVLPLLPPQLAINVSEEATHKAAAAGARGESWPEFDKSVTAEADGPDQIEVHGDGFVERLILWGRGDFNHDGIEDLLVQSLDTLTEGTYRNTRLFVVTRKTGSGKLSIVRTLP